MRVPVLSRSCDPCRAQEGPVTKSTQKAMVTMVSKTSQAVCPDASAAGGESSSLGGGMRKSMKHKR